MSNTPGTATGGGISPGLRTLNDFKNRISGGGARPNLFECEINFPTGIDLTASDDGVALAEKTRFLVKAAQLPGSTINVIDIPFRGRNLKIAGDRTFDPWTITIINDVDFNIRNAFEKWMNYMNKHEDNSGELNPIKYQRDMKVYQLGKAGINGDMTTNGNMQVLKAYQFYGMFPTSISAIDLSYDQADTIEEFTVDLQVQWWDAFDGGGKTILGSGNTEEFDGNSSSADALINFPLS
jgi:hypothetical protein